jgi:hypothetical protein
MPRRLLLTLACAALAVGSAVIAPGPAIAATAVGGISGRVTEVGGTALSGVSVKFISASTSLLVATKTSATNGTYSDTALPVGKYRVCFDPGTGNHGGHSTDGYTYQCWLNKNAAQLPDPVAVAKGMMTVGIGVALHANGAVSGLVTDTNGVPIAGAVIAINPSVSTMTTTTNSDGTYLITAVPSELTVVCASGPTTGVGGGPYGWAPKCWRTDQTYNNPVLILVKPGQTTQNIDFRLSKNGALSGTITDVSSAPVSNVDVTLHPLAVGGVDTTYTETGGLFEFDDLAPGFYTVCAQDGSAAAACWHDAAPGSATTIVVAPTVNVRGIAIVVPS